MEEWLTIWQSRELFIAGFSITAQLFVISSIMAFITACFFLYVLNSDAYFIKKVLAGFIHIMRTLPFLILAYLIYYGLPQFGIRLDAFSSGIVALVMYHSAYFCEVFRCRQLVLPKGQIEAAQAHGFRSITIFRRITLPNVVMTSLPLVGNQLILCLKDTAFLSVITVKDITSAANTVQSIHFIPFKAFIVAIALYWILNVSIEYGVKKLSLFSKKKGFVHA